MPKIGYGEVQKYKRTPKYPILKWVEGLREKHKQWKRNKKGRGRPYVELIHGEDFTIASASMRHFVYRWNMGREDPYPITVRVVDNNIRLYWED